MTPSDVAEIDTMAASPGLADDLARFAAGVDIGRLDTAVIQAVKTNALDTLSCGLAGSSAKAIAEVSKLVREWRGAAHADMFVFGGKFPPTTRHGSMPACVMPAITTIRTTPPCCMPA